MFQIHISATTIASLRTKLLHHLEELDRGASSGSKHARIDRAMEFLHYHEVEDPEIYSIPDGSAVAPVSVRSLTDVLEQISGQSNGFLLMNVREYADVRSSGRDFLDLETSKEYLTRGCQGEIRGFTVITSPRVPVGMVVVCNEDFTRLGRVLVIR